MTQAEFLLPALLGGVAAFLTMHAVLEATERRRQRRMVDAIVGAGRAPQVVGSRGRVPLRGDAAVQLGAALVSGPIGWWLAGWPGAVVAPLVSWYAMRWATRRRRRGALERAREQFPRAIQVVASSLLAGATTYQALSRAAAETPLPLGEHLRRTVERFGVNMTSQEAFRALREELPDPSTATVLAVLEIQRTMGGNMAALLTDLAAGLQAQETLRRDSRVLTTQARYSAHIVGALPWAVLLVLTVLFREYVAPLYDQDLGRLLLAIAVASGVTGLVLVRRIAAAVERAAS